MVYCMTMDFWFWYMVSGMQDHQMKKLHLWEANESYSYAKFQANRLNM